MRGFLGAVFRRSLGFRGPWAPLWRALRLGGVLSRTSRRARRIPRVVCVRMDYLSFGFGTSSAKTELSLIWFWLVGVSGFAKILFSKLRSVPFVKGTPTRAESCENKFCQLEVGKTYFFKVGKLKFANFKSSFP